MEILFSVLFLMLGIIQAIFMWLNYKECKQQKNTDKD